MKNKALILTIGMLIILSLSIFASLEFLNTNQSTPEFFVGVEMAYTNATFGDVKNLVDKAKDYTNLFVIGSIELTYNETALNESCDYINNAGLKIIVLFTKPQNYNFSTLAWLTTAQQKYGNGFLGLYRYDEPGGSQLDSSEFRFVNDTTNYADTAANYTEILRAHVDYYVNSADRIFTADYGLYWWDYKTNYTAIFAEFVGNQSRQRHIALCRGAAQAHDKSWGAIITWKYNDDPFLEDETDLYDDLKLAYAAGAKYIIVFDYPKIGPFGTLTENHFDALKRFWDYSHSNPQAFGSTKASVAYVLPKDYGFGLRGEGDTIWGFFPADELSKKVWNDVSTLVSRYGAGFDILFDDEELDDVASRYNKVIFWNETVMSG